MGNQVPATWFLATQDPPPGVARDGAPSGAPSLVFRSVGVVWEIDGCVLAECRKVRDDLSMTDLSNRWNVVDGRLHTEVEFADFAEAFAFMTEVASLAEAANHHPDWSNSWNRVVIDLMSHDAGAITDRDRALAAQIDALLDV